MRFLMRTLTSSPIHCCFLVRQQAYLTSTLLATSASSYPGANNSNLESENVIENKMNGSTTNAFDQAEAKRLKERLETGAISDTTCAKVERSISIPNVSIDEGANKYVLITAIPPGSSKKDRSTFVVSKLGAEYHRNAAEPFVDRLQAAGYTGIDIEGGGRILRDDSAKKIFIYGYSYGFGRADHAQAKVTVDADKEFSDYEVTWSNDGY